MTDEDASERLKALLEQIRVRADLLKIREPDRDCFKRAVSGMILITQALENLQCMTGPTKIRTDFENAANLLLAAGRSHFEIIKRISPRAPEMVILEQVMGAWMDFQASFEG